MLALNLLLLLALAAADALCRALHPALGSALNPNLNPAPRRAVDPALDPALTQELDPALRQAHALAPARMEVQVPQRALPSPTVAEEQKKPFEIVQQRPPGLLEALGNQMLAVFLLANMLTGVVNLSVDTLAVGGAAARGILVVYAGLLCGAAVLLQRGNVRLRLSYRTTRGNTKWGQ